MTICSTPQLRELLGEIDPKPPTSTGVFFSSKHYHAVGCDLADTSKLDRILATLVSIFVLQSCTYDMNYGMSKV